MSGRPDRVMVWASQLAANNFPPICAMTGQPAEAWRRFRFATPPSWAYVLLILACLGGIGLIPYIIITTVIAQRASGYLPLTRVSRLKVNLAFWLPLALLGLWLVLWLAAAIFGLFSSDKTLNTLATVLLWLGLLAMFGGVLGRLVVTRLVGPRAKVGELIVSREDRLVELRNVHPVFAAAVNQMHARWAAQSAALPQTTGAPQIPGST